MSKKQLYRVFLRSSWWQETRRRIYDKASGECESCGLPCAFGYCHTAHLSYDSPQHPESTWPRGWMPASDHFLALLCPSCHWAYDNVSLYAKYGPKVRTDILLKIFARRSGEGRGETPGES